MLNRDLVELRECMQDLVKRTSRFSEDQSRFAKFSQCNWLNFGEGQDFVKFSQDFVKFSLDLVKFDQFGGVPSIL